MRFNPYLKARSMLLAVAQMPGATRAGKRLAARKFLAQHAQDRGADAIDTEALAAVCAALGLEPDAKPEEVYVAIEALIGPRAAPRGELREALGIRKILTLVTRPTPTFYPVRNS